MAAGLTNIAATDATLTGRAMRTKSVDGTQDTDMWPVVALDGSRGVSHAANLTNIPHVGANFAAGPFNGYVPICTVNANDARSELVSINHTGGLVVAVLDDGSADPGQAPVNASLRILGTAPADSPPDDSAIFRSIHFRGRVTFYAAAAPAGDHFLIADEH